MLPALISQWHPPGLGRAEFDTATALKLAEGQGIDPRIAWPLIVAVQSGVREAQRRVTASEGREA